MKQEGMILQYDKTGIEVQVGDTATDFHGRPWIVVGGVNPYSPGTSGRVWVKPLEDDERHQMRAFFPNVFGMTWRAAP